jgi:DMSO/TMAO reductase YedYZ molybdopterin-dependent catalytic subunit
MGRGDILVAYEMNGVTLPIGQGYPARLVVPGGEGNEWVRWLERIELSTATPTQLLEPHPVHSRIFDPLDGEAMALGTHTISGVAFVGEEREITRVEVSTDGGASWRDAQLLNTFVPNVWQHWEFTWSASQAGAREIVARAEDDLGNLQSENDPVYGWNTLSVDVVVEASSIPALSGWGVIILAIAILGIGRSSVGS